jgi:hypothetical protein
MRFVLDDILLATTNAMKVMCCNRNDDFNPWYICKNFLKVLATLVCSDWGYIVLIIVIFFRLNIAVIFGFDRKT